MSKALKLIFFVPEGEAEAVKEALFNSGAGHLGNYDRCCWQSNGQGQFRPNSSANPSIGETAVISYVPELRVEMLVDRDRATQVQAALIDTHPYETPAFEWIEVYLDCDHVTD